MSAKPDPAADPGRTGSTADASSTSATDAASSTAPADRPGALRAAPDPSSRDPTVGLTSTAPTDRPISLHAAPDLSPPAPTDGLELGHLAARRGAWPAGSDARALADELRRRVRGQVRFDDGSRALYATDSSNYRQVPIGVVEPLDVDDLVEAIAVCRGHGAPIVARGAGTSLAGQGCNVAVVLDLSRHLNRILEIRSAAPPGARAAGARPGHLARGRGVAWPDLRAGSGNAQPLHAGRHDRQQFLRRSFRHGGQDGRQRPRARDPDLRRGADERRPHHRRGAATHRAGGRPARRDLRRPAPVAGSHGAADPGPLPSHPSPRLGLQPGRAAAGTGFPRRPGAGRQRRHLRDRRLGDLAAGAESARTRSAGAGLRGRISGGRCRAAGARGRPDRPGRHRPAVGGAAAQEEDASRGPRRAARGGRLASGRAGRSGCGRGRNTGKGTDGPPSARDEAARDAPFSRSPGAAPPVGGARERAGQHGSHSGRGRHLGGLRGRGGRAGAAGRVPARAVRPGAKPRLRLRAVRPLRGRLCPQPHQLRPEVWNGNPAIPGVHARGRRSGAAPRRLAVRGTWRRTGPCRAVPQDVRARAGPGVRDVQAAVGPGRQDEPRQDGGSIQDGRESAARLRVPAAAASHCVSLSRR